MDTWEMVKLITKHPNKRFRSLIDGQIVLIELGSSIRSLDSSVNFMLHIDDKWEEIN